MDRWGPTVSLPTVSVEQMREVDRIMVEGLGIELLQMMENAGRALAHRPRRCSAATRSAAG
jgi:NAD(P)H-hydrate repair Nnr-like enzyme with NAD(P)H-hydrate epimerase domain